MQAAIFDMDGTLVETEQVWSDVREAFVTSHGGRWHDGAQPAMMGMRTAQWAQYLHDDLGVAMPAAEIARQVVDRIVERLQSVPVLPGAEAALQRLARAFPLAIATSSALPVATAVLERTGWGRYFKAVVSADEVAHGKPEPDVYLRALAALGAEPCQTVAIEDSTNGIRAAHAAGLVVVAIPNREFPPQASALALATRVIGSLDALDAELVRSLLG